MSGRQPSQTAKSVAVRRAAHQVLDVPPVFADPLAIRIAGTDVAELQSADAGDPKFVMLGRILRATVAVRSRIAEDEVDAAVVRGVRQYVVLGAGYDTFAYRNPYETLRVFELDQPATQAAKRQRLVEAGIGVPAGTTFVPVDFAAISLADELERHGFDAGAGAVFSWLGGTPYLERDAVLHTIQTVARIAGGGGRLVFDYSLPPAYLDQAHRAAFDMLLRRFDALGEPFLTAFEPAAIAGALTACGFTSVTDLEPDALNARYFSGRTDGLRVGTLFHVIVAANPD